MVVLWCEKCREAFESSTLDARFCSKKCRSAAREDVVKCRVCGREMYDPPRRARPPLYCSRECAARARVEQNRRNLERKADRSELRRFPLAARTCETCGAEFETRFVWQRYCTVKCREKAARERRKGRLEAAAAGWMECPRCRETFEATDPDARPPYCSERCERLDRRRREMAAETRKAHEANVARHREFLAAEAAIERPTDWEW